MTGGQTRCVKVCIEKKNYDFVVPILYNSLVWKVKEILQLYVVCTLYLIQIIIIINIKKVDAGIHCGTLLTVV